MKMWIVEVIFVWVVTFFFCTMSDHRAYLLHSLVFCEIKCLHNGFTSRVSYRHSHPCIVTEIGTS